MPETSAGEAWERIGMVLEAVAGATFSVRGQEIDRNLADTVGLADSGPGIVGADALLDAATAALPPHVHRDTGDLT